MAVICCVCGKDIGMGRHYITRHGDVCVPCYSKARSNYLKEHGFSESEGWDDDYYACDFAENWHDYI